jgi:metal-responsive CopG/Arc/MetJ family transcriptional regulator
MGGEDMATEKPRFTISVDEALFEQIEDFRFSNRYQTRAEATAELIRLGLKYLKEHPDAPK